MIMPSPLVAGLIVVGAALGGMNLMADEQSHGSDKKMQIATFGEGCFWCAEAVFERLNGVEKVVSGFSGGHLKNPTYKQVCTGKTGHAEVVQITYDPKQISYEKLLTVFWKTHDPTTLNRQGNDLGTQYHSVIFYHNDEQRKLAERFKKKLNAAKTFHAPVVTQIVAFREFFPAEHYHQDYFRLHGRQPYCQLVIEPKVRKLDKVFATLLKPKLEKQDAIRYNQR
ncbi:MAG: peptide-methionine (S)-S-oxide reductase MsrA [Thermoguttaceae bacterium]